MNATITPQELQGMLAANTATVCDVRRRADYEADPRTIPVPHGMTRSRWTRGRRNCPRTNP